MRTLIIILLVIIVCGCDVGNSKQIHIRDNFTRELLIHENLSIRISETVVQFSDDSMRNSDSSIGFNTREIIIKNKSENKLSTQLLNETYKIIRSHCSKYYSLTKMDWAYNYSDNWHLDSMFYDIDGYTSDTLRIIDPFKDADSISLNFDFYNEEYEKIELRQLIVTRELLK